MKQGYGVVLENLLERDHFCMSRALHWTEHQAFRCLENHVVGCQPYIQRTVGVIDPRADDDPVMDKDTANGSFVMREGALGLASSSQTSAAHGSRWTNDFECLFQEIFVDRLLGGSSSCHP